MCTLVLTVIAVGMWFCTWRGLVNDFVASHSERSSLQGPGNRGMSLIIYLAMYLIVGHGIRAFRIGVERTTNIMASQVMTVFVTDLAETFVTMAITGYWRLWRGFLGEYAVLWILQSVVLVIVSVIMIFAYRAMFPPIDIIEIYGRENGVYDKMNLLAFKYHISKSIYAGDYKTEEILQEIKDHEAVLINDLSAKKRNKILKACFDMDKRVYVVPKISDVIMKHSEALNLIDTPLYLCRNREITLWQSVIKRILDVVVCVLATVILSPVLIITALAIKLEDGGPVFYRQERVTEGGRRFNILKFRSMIVDAEADGKPHPAGENDSRITKVGKIIRGCRIDELPQLLNIIKGDMSIVGPRPERVEHVEKYTKEIPEFAFRLKMKGGLTGYAQVYGKYNTSALDKLKLDLTYITNYSLLTDIQIIFETVKILFFRESTEGFD